MISKELKKLTRRELVDVIYQLKKNEEQMQEKITALETELKDRRIHLSAAGSIAEAAMDITGVFSVAQSTADLYLREISLMKEEAGQECEKMIEEAKKKVETIIDDAQSKYDALAARYRTDSQKWQQLRAEIEKLEKKASEG